MMKIENDGLQNFVIGKGEGFLTFPYPDNFSLYDEIILKSNLPHKYFFICRKGSTNCKISKQEFKLENNSNETIIFPFSEEQTTSIPNSWNSKDLSTVKIIPYANDSTNFFYITGALDMSTIFNANMILNFSFQDPVYTTLSFNQPAKAFYLFGDYIKASLTLEGKENNGQNVIRLACLESTEKLH